MKQIKSACAGFLFMASAGCSAVGIHTVEEAVHTTLVTDGSFSVRQYDDDVIAATFVETAYEESGSIGLRRIAVLIDIECALRTRLPDRLVDRGGEHGSQPPTPLASSAHRLPQGAET